MKPQRVLVIGVPGVGKSLVCSGEINLPVIEIGDEILRTALQLGLLKDETQDPRKLHIREFRRLQTTTFRTVLKKNQSKPFIIIAHGSMKPRGKFLGCFTQHLVNRIKLSYILYISASPDKILERRGGGDKISYFPNNPGELSRQIDFERRYYSKLCRKVGVPFREIQNEEKIKFPNNWITNYYTALNKRIETVKKEL